MIEYYLSSNNDTKIQTFSPTKHTLRIKKVGNFRFHDYISLLEWYFWILQHLTNVVQVWGITLLIWRGRRNVWASVNAGWLYAEKGDLSISLASPPCMAPPRCNSSSNSRIQITRCMMVRARKSKTWSLYRVQGCFRRKFDTDSMRGLC